jgi:hypothetical protein
MGGIAWCANVHLFPLMSFIIFWGRGVRYASVVQIDGVDRL